MVALTVDHLCPLSSVSEELLFGDPIVLSFNVANQLDWETFKHNKYMFFSLCRSLAKESQGLIVYTQQVDLHGNESCPFVKKYYLLLPSDVGTHFLAKVDRNDWHPNLPRLLLLKNICFLQSCHL
jgi:hypothetical protein